MGILQKMNDEIRKGIRSWLNITPSNPYAIQINEVLDFELNAIRNRIWYRGDSNELEQMYGQNPDYADKYKFWASRSSPGMEMRKIHTGLPSLIVKVLTAVTIVDMNEFDFESEKQKQIWKEIEKQNKFCKNLKKSLKEVLFVGDGAYKVVIDTTVSQYPILEWVSGEKIEIISRHGKVREIVFKTPYESHKQLYVLHEHYGHGYITNHLYRGEQEVPLNSIEEASGLSDYAFDESVMLAVPLQVYESNRFEGRGGSIFDGKLDAFDAFDEVFSQWMDALRKGRATKYIPTDLIPRDPTNGALRKSNPFDNSYIEIRGGLGEKDGNRVEVAQPTIPHESYLASYVTALDLCLQGIISPSTLGIDTKKLDNAEAQREKEKTTLYTRNAIVGALQETLPELVTVALQAYQILNKMPLEDVKVSIPFGEYANPSFESQVETVGKGRQQGIMSIEASVEELYGDTREEAWKAEEVERLKTEQGIAQMEETQVATELGDFSVSFAEEDTKPNDTRVERSDSDESKGDEPRLSDGQKRV